MKSVSELLNKLTDLRAKYSVRDERYLANWYAYCGDYDRLYTNYSSDPLAMSRNRTEKTIQKWNLVRPIVDTHKVLINQLPTIEVPAPLLGLEVAALKADKTEKVLYALWDMMRMQRKHGEGAFNIALNFATVFQGLWDDEKDIPVINVRAPGETYPVLKRNGEAISYCFFRWEEDTESIAEKYPQVKPLLTRNRLGQFAHAEIEVIEYVDESRRLMIIGGDAKSLIEGEGGEHDLGSAPVFVVGGAYVPGEIFPPGHIDQLVAMNDHLNRFQTKLGDAIEETLFGWHDVTGDGAELAKINTGPGAVNYLEGNLKHEYTQPQAPPAQAFGHVDLVQRYMRNLSNWPDVASGESNASVITGKGVSRLRGVLDAQIAETQSNLGEGLAYMNALCLRMLETYRGDKKYTLYASEPVTLTSAPGRKRDFTVTFVPNEDFQGYYHNALHYSPFGSDLNASMQIGMQLVDARIFPRSWLRNLIPGGSDAEGMAAEIREEDRERAQFEADLQVEVQQRILQAQYEQQAQLMALEQNMGGTGAPAASAPAPGNAPPTQGGLPPQSSPGGQMIGNAMLMPGGQPQLMGMGEPLTEEAENFPIPYTPVKPFGPAVAGLAGSGMHGAAANEQALGAGTQEEAMPGRNVVRSQEITEALAAAVNRKGEKATDKLKGQVYLMGEMAERGWTDGKVEIGITVKSDQQIITTALPQLAAQNLLVFRVLSTPNPEGGVLIFGPGAAAPQEQPAPVR